MFSKESFPTLTIVFLALAAYCCPLVRPWVGIDMSGTTSTLTTYYWMGSLLYFLLAIMVFPKLTGAPKTFIQYALLLCITIVVTESVCAFAYKWHSGYWSHADSVNLNRHLFEKHPYLIGKPKKGALVERDGLRYEHNSFGYRGDEFDLEKSSDKTRVITIGGSTTYGVGVNNQDTWPYLLGQELGERFEVLNLGIPGHSTAENLIQTALSLSDFNPDIVIYHVGLNDIRNANVKNLQSDYSRFHAPILYSSLGLCHSKNAPMLATFRVIILFLQKIEVLESCPEWNESGAANTYAGIDEKALTIYERNLKNIVALCAAQEIKVLFVPQILLEEVMTSGDYSWWVPHVPTEELDDVMDAYNSTMKSVADSNRVHFSESIMRKKWTKKDFVDLSHFNANANKRFAELLAKDVLEVASEDTLAVTE